MNLKSGGSMRRELTANGKLYQVSGEWKAEKLKIIFTGQVVDAVQNSIIAKLEYSIPPGAKIRLGTDTFEEDIMTAVREDIIGGNE
jgi:hypothetical protein